MEKIISIGIVDDNVKIAEQLMNRLRFATNVKVAFYVERGHLALKWLENSTERPDLILMDIEMPEMDGIETTFRIRQQFPDIKILMLTVFDNDEAIFKSIQAGASGYFLKEEKLPRILSAFEEVLEEGGAPMSPAIAKRALQLMINGYQPPAEKHYEAHQAILTQRELEILGLLAEGHKNQVIADQLSISFSTVKKHIENIYGKLQLRSRVELVNWFKQYR